MPDRPLARRAVVAFLLLLAAVFLLSLRLYDLAVFEDEAREVLNGQYSRAVTVAARTGFLYDRTGERISHHAAGGVAVVDPARVSDKNALLDALSPYTDTPFAEKLLADEPFTLTLTSLPPLPLPAGASAYPLWRETDGPFLRHLQGYRDGDGNAVCGLFKRCEDLLADCGGTLSYRYEADAADNTVFADSFTLFDDGYGTESGLVLTVDAGTQRAVEGILDEGLAMGAAVLADAETGEIRALASRPAYDPANLAASLSSDRGDFLDRTALAYTPGSVFKLVVAAAALETDDTLLDFSCTCTGSVTVGGRVFHCHKRDGHGERTLAAAFADSCNVYFITLAREIGLAAIADTARKMGVGLPHLSAPSPSSLPDRLADAPETYLAGVAFGQGDLAVTPLDMTSAVIAASTGAYTPLSVVRGVYRDGVLTPFPHDPGSRTLKHHTVRKLREMMRLCVTDGTGRAAFSDSVLTYGKTATAQSGQYKDGEEVLHRWFAGCFEAGGRLYALTVLADGAADDNENPALLFRRIAETVAALPVKADGPPFSPRDP